MCFMCSVYLLTIIVSVFCRLNQPQTDISKPWPLDSSQRARFLARLFMSLYI